MTVYRVTYTRWARKGDGACTGSVTKTQHVEARNAAHAGDLVLRRDQVDEVEGLWDLHATPTTIRFATR